MPSPPIECLSLHSSQAGRFLAVQGSSKDANGGGSKSSIPIPFREALAQLESSHRYELEQIQSRTDVFPPSARERCSESLPKDLELLIHPPLSSRKESLRSNATLDNFVPQRVMDDDERNPEEPELGRQVSNITIQSTATHFNNKVLDKWLFVCEAYILFSYEREEEHKACKLNPAWFLTSLAELVTLTDVHDVDPRKVDRNGLNSDGVSSKSWEKFRTSCTSSNSTVATRPNLPRCNPLHPTDKRRLSWDVLGLLLIVYEIVMLPLLIASLSEGHRHVSYGSCIFWTFDLLSTFITGFFTNSGDVELRFQAIAIEYFKSWLVIDSVLVLVDWFMILIGDSLLNSGRVMKSILRFGRVFRLLRILKVGPRLQAQLGRVTSGLIFASIRLVMYLTVIILFNHYVACFWVALWTERVKFSTSKAYSYLTGLHWSFAHCLLGSMDVYPENVGERIFTCAVLVISLVVFSILLGMITNDALMMKTLHSEKTTKTALLLSFFGDHSLPPHLVCKVWHFVAQHRLLEGKMQKQERDSEALALLPVHVQQEVRVHWFRPMLTKHPFFRHYDELEPAALSMLCCNDDAITVISLLPEERMLFVEHGHQSHQVEHMLFVEHGRLDYYPDDFSECIAIKAGMWACEEALWSTCATISGRMQAGLGSCDVVLVSFAGFRDIAREYFCSLDFVMRYARDFVNVFNQSCMDFKEEDILFNDETTIAKIVSTAARTRSGSHIVNMINTLTNSTQTGRSSNLSTLQTVRSSAGSALSDRPPVSVGALSIASMKTSFRQSVSSLTGASSSQEQRGGQDRRHQERRHSFASNSGGRCSPPKRGNSNSSFERNSQDRNRRASLERGRSGDGRDRRFGQERRFSHHSHSGC